LEKVKEPEIIKRNPNGQIPVIEEKDGFVLYESNAILPYLADKYKAHDWYPTDLRARAKINQYLHWHHSAIRANATNGLFVPLVNYATKAISADVAKAQIDKAKKVFPSQLAILEAHLKDHKWIGGSYEKPTIADLHAYTEIGQLQFLELWDFKDLPHLRRWIADVEKLPKHDQVHKVSKGPALKEFLQKTHHSLYPSTSTTSS